MVAGSAFLAVAFEKGRLKQKSGSRAAALQMELCLFG
jgi:hypothetical protein